ncbi:hypothetical protein K2X14_15525 [Acetobacter sp. TBRC 12305]|uniref:EF-hand domain-containing protein n=1 Tax=Acetobacter garciniae TaxID=2817435 RepID=A0A939HR37_9PROT|nr:hypothetical protein [Acetobacter garciniae]MBO1326572.1 hypothetical protein [Acetobacter garciniae]MBX0346245.1 hypothetical protein [Acetobacter garciniae]
MTGTGKAFFAALVLLGLPASAQAHRLDEYLQATTVTLARDHILLHLRLTPGVDVAESIIRQIDRNGDGRLSFAERRSYVWQVTQRLSFSLNGHSDRLLTEVAKFPSLTAIRTGTGVIDLQIRIKTSLQKGNYHLAYTNRGAGPETVWLVNCLQPQDPAIHIVQQKRSENQSSYMLDFSISPS